MALVRYTGPDGHTCEVGAPNSLADIVNFLAEQGIDPGSLRAIVWPAAPVPTQPVDAAKATDAVQVRKS